MCAWAVKGSCSTEDRLLIPPAISNSGVGGRRPVILQERETLVLTCATSGDPRPTVAWSRYSSQSYLTVCCYSVPTADGMAAP